MADQNGQHTAEPAGNSNLVVAGQGRPPAPYEGGYDRSYGGGYTTAADRDDDSLVKALRLFLHIVWKRRWLIASITLAMLVLAAVVTFLQTPQYTASVRLQIEREAAKVIEGAEVSPSESPAASAEFLRTQVELLQSRALAERVVLAAQLTANKQFMEERASLLGSLRHVFQAEPSTDVSEPAELKRRAADKVVENVSVKPVPGSRLVDVSYTDTSPALAQRIANSYADGFIAANLDKRFEANAYAKTFLEDQVQQLKVRLEESEKALVEYAEREQILEAIEKSSVTENSLNAANAALGNIVAEKLKAEQQWRQVENTDGLNLPQLLSNAAIDGLRARRNTLVAEYEEKLETFKPSYPAMVQLTNRIKETDRQIAFEVKAIRDALKAAYEAASSQETEMQRRIEALRNEALELQRRGIQYNILKREAETNRNLYNGLLQRFKQVDVAAGVGTNNVFVVDRAALPRMPSSPKLVRALALAFALALLGGIGAAYALEFMDDRVRAPDEMEAFTALPTLGVIPSIEEAQHPLDLLFDPRSAFAESYRSLATSLQFASQTGLPRSIVVTSSGPAEGKSTTSLALARHFAMTGLKVLLIDADLRRPSLHLQLGVDNSTGLCNYLTGAVSPPEVIQQTDVPLLAFLPSGPLPPNAADILAGPRMHSLVTVGLEVFDLIVIDAPPILGLADAPLLSSAAQATIFVVAAGQPRKPFIQSALQRLRMARANVVGAVLTKFDAKASSYGYGYGNSAYEYYGYGAAAPASVPDQRVPSHSQSSSGVA